MCQIVVIKSNKKLSKEFLNQQFNTNRDGIGFCYFKERKWYWKKFMNFDEFYNFYENTEYEKCVIHFRFGTSGSKDVSNVHPFLISKERDIDLNEGVLKDDEILLMQNGVTNKVFNIAKFVLSEDLREKNYSDTRTIAYLLKKLNVFDVEEIAKRLAMIDNTSRFAIISNSKLCLLGNFIKHEKNVYLSSHCLYRIKTKKRTRLDSSFEIEKIISEKLNINYIKTNLYYNLDTNLFELELENEKRTFGLKGLKKFLIKIGVEESKVQEIVEKIKKDIEKEKEKQKEKKDNNYYYDYYYYRRWWW